MSAALPARHARHPRAALRAGVDYIARAQHQAGCWTDFWVPVGSSDAWVSAYVGLALHAASVCPSLDRYTFRTYNRHEPAHQWARPCPDVSAAALRALYEIGELHQPDLG